MRNGQSRLLSALRKRMRVTRKTAIENGWAENLTAPIAKTPEGKPYSRYRLLSEPVSTALAA